MSKTDQPLDFLCSSSVLVGGLPKTVAARLREYQALGVDVEKAYCVSDPLFPELGLPGPRGQLRTSFGDGRYGGNVRLTSAS